MFALGRTIKAPNVVQKRCRRSSRYFVLDAEDKAKSVEKEEDGCLVDSGLRGDGLNFSRCQLRRLCFTHRGTPIWNSKFHPREVLLATIIRRRGRRNATNIVDERQERHTKADIMIDALRFSRSEPIRRHLPTD